MQVIRDDDPVVPGTERPSRARLEIDLAQFEGAYAASDVVSTETGEYQSRV